MRPFVFGDAEASVLAYLRDKMPELASGTDFPVTEPSAPYLVVRRYGGNYRPPAIDYARFSIETWCTSRSLAQDTLQAALGWLFVAHLENRTYTALDGTLLPRITKVFVESGPQYFPDGVSTEHRWISTVAVYMRALESHEP
ncbi:hypothetical protein GCM10012275_08030 [Longimycelium tulufanense]|uniref:Tail terminator n=1 Tax=Longimycelium tulufanense TaxID=907463 RepID=A0A8J3FTG2_9PSEU|nr:hypothetical protein [Longimycelium tulufanense]GGM39544.1 hypothetical protein GCM10012275_08030 [Longimycelium tulufanense]